ncbi:hypothetical protein AT268_32585 [Bacillus cereus]|uniref:Uncharacterized protein n=1 Tax=Bacillus cereus TaxID=1396 RepID=A0A9X0SPF8_BACCE|nr:MULTISPECIES: hypothetical protein [Bacillus cereus group]KXY51230.1 hypothetical protein AT268_32585 [Bacillus cereus]PES55167.1 hypothetical protein CN515_03675 [Bacillus cereus]PFA29568.1 hypothetical protein CN384_07700 [Bacillus thuringiensis]
MKKSDKIDILKRMLYEVEVEASLAEIGGFTEYDQSEIEFLHNTLINHLSAKGLELYMDFIEECTKVGIQKKKPTTKEEMIENLKKDGRDRGFR